MTAVDGMRSAYVAAYNAGDTAAVVSFFDDGAVYFPPVSTPKTGRDEIRPYLSGELAQEPTLELTSTRTEVVTGGCAMDHGTWSVDVSPRSAPKERRVTGSYLAVVRRVEGDWRFVRFADTYDALPTVPIPEAVR